MISIQTYSDTELGQGLHYPIGKEIPFHFS